MRAQLHRPGQASPDLDPLENKGSKLGLNSASAAAATSPTYVTIFYCLLESLVFSCFNNSARYTDWGWEDAVEVGGGSRVVILYVQICLVICRSKICFFQPKFAHIIFRVFVLEISS